MQEERLPNISERDFWCQAASLRERLPLPDGISHQELSDEQREKARLQLDRWRGIFGHDEALYQECLESLALSEQNLFYLLTESPAELCQRLPHVPVWFHTFSAAFELFAEPDDGFLESLLTIDRADAEISPQEPRQEQRNIHLLLTVVEPLIRLGRNRLLESIRAIEQNFPVPALMVDELLSSLLSALVGRLQNLLSRTLILEFRVAQRQGYFSENETLSECLHSFARHLRRHDVALAFFTEYPVLARQVTICIEQWCESNREMLTRLGQDWPLLQQLFCPGNDPGSLQEVDSSLGDRHRGGRSVQVLLFTSGFRLVYKPRSLAIDMHFQTFLQWLNDHGQEPPFHILQVLDRSSYGWVEWVETRGCTSSEEIERFYLRQGANLALLYALEATDFHFENILAAGEYPVLVDLESLIHVPTRPSSPSFGPVEQLAYGNVSSSVLRTLLLPYRSLQDEDEAWAEISGLGGAPGQVLPTRILQLGGFDTGELRFAHERAILQGGKNRPSLNGEEVDIL